MRIEYSYIKPRHQFGKQCIFEFEDNIAKENVWPDPEKMQNYIIRQKTHCSTQTPKQLAVHEVQTIEKEIKNTGVLHLEGGWPREINPADNEATYRFRRRVEREDQWAITMHELMPQMEHYILQNNAVNIYTNFFDDMIPTTFRMDYKIRIRNSYPDPQENARPIRHLSWSENASNRLAAAYSFAEFDVHLTDASPYSYVWDVGTQPPLMLFDDEPRLIDAPCHGTSKILHFYSTENPNTPMTALRSSSPSMTLEFNPRDPSLLVSGLMSGQVCCWDIRTSDEPVQISLPSVSHRRPTCETVWTTSKANSEFFSAAIDGMVLWWDTRFLKTPVDTLVMDLDDPARADLIRAVGVTALQFEPTISSRFLAGTEGGVVVNVNRRASQPAEKLSMRFNCYVGPVMTIDRNPAFTKYFLTIGDWSAKVWSDDTREGCLLSTGDDKTTLSGGCWSQSRSSVFFTINTEGTLAVYDILAGTRSPLTSIHVSDQNFTAISAHDEGEFLAVGSQDGNIYVLQCTEGLTTFSKEDRAFLSGYLDRGSRYEKLADNRVKEIRLFHVSEQEEPRKNVSAVKVPRKTKEKKKEKKDSTEDKDKTENLKKPKRRKSRRRTTLLLGGPEVIVAEQDYFRAIEEYSAKMEAIDPADVEAARDLMKQREVVPPVEEEKEPEKTESKVERKSRRLTSRTRRTHHVRRSEVKAEKEEPSVEVDSELAKKLQKKRRGKRVLQKACKTDVCKPEICCRDVVEKRKAEILEKMKRHLQEEDFPKRISLDLQEKWFRRLTENLAEIPDHSETFKKKMLLLRKQSPMVLQQELKEAKSEVRAWQERAIAKKLSSRKIEEKLDLKVPEEKKQKTDQKATEADTERRVSKTGEKKEVVLKQPDARFLPGSKKIKITSEATLQEEEEKLYELWTRLKQKVKQQEPPQKQLYPRISAAEPPKSSEDLSLGAGDPGAK